MVRIQRYPQGSRVRLRPGRFPIDPELVDRMGTIVHHERRSPEKYGVQLDGESGIRVFTEDELDVASAAGSLDERGEPRGGSGSDTSF